VNPVQAAWNTVARFDDYGSAQRAVDRLWGGIFGFAAHLATRGERDFSSLRGLTATHYDLIARKGGAQRARAALDQARPAAGRSPLDRVIRRPWRIRPGKGVPGQASRPKKVTNRLASMPSAGIPLAMMRAG
jgi:hypothetical protein